MLYRELMFCTIFYLIGLLQLDDALAVATQSTMKKSLKTQLQKDVLSRVVESLSVKFY